MPVKKAKPTKDANTEEKIKTAAHIVFHKKGFAATRTRDIAAEAGINLALLNYYFRSKEKLFDLIMLETITVFLYSMEVVFNNAGTTLEQKIQLMSEKYIDMLIAEPEMPIFLMSEIREGSTEVLDKLPIINTILQSVFVKQYKDAVKKGAIMEMHPIHFLMNLAGLIVFPFVNSPMIKKIGKLSDREFKKLMLERKAMIPVWVKAMFKPA